MKPYAWINVNDEYKILFDDELPTHYPEAWMPLYTHPAKTLTDEEIQEIAHGFEAIGWMGETTYEFARAILRKAQDEQQVD
jgi:hypothetical protein